jgi:hypothetical protein
MQLAHRLAADSLHARLPNDAILSSVSAATPASRSRPQLQGPSASVRTRDEPPRATVREAGPMSIRSPFQSAALNGIRPHGVVVAHKQSNSSASIGGRTIPSATCRCPGHEPELLLSIVLAATSSHRTVAPDRHAASTYPARHHLAVSFNRSSFFASSSGNSESKSRMK